MLISRKTSDALDILYGQFFNLNSLLDNAVSFMLNDWSMVQASEIIHKRLAHATPLLADKISEIKDDYDERSIRPEVPEHKETYGTLKEMFDAIYDEFEATYRMIVLTNKIALDEGDINVHAGLMEFMRTFNKIIGQIITLKNKADQGLDFDTFDFHIKDWGIVGLDGEE